MSEIIENQRIGDTSNQSLEEKASPQTPVEFQKELERLYNKNQLLPRLRKEFLESSLDFEGHMVLNEIPVPFGIDVLVQIALHKRADLKTMVGLLRHHTKEAQSTADLLYRCVEIDLVDWDCRLQKFIVKWCISDDVQVELDQFQYPLPMVVPPLELKTNRDTGYYLNPGKTSVILRNNHHEEDVCLDHLNRMNQIKLTVNLDVVRFIKNKWKNLDKPKEGETREEFEQRVRAFKKYDKHAKAVLEFLMSGTDDECFYLTHKYDKRGRTYCQGYYATYQGNAWNKASVEFSEKEIVE